MRQLDLIDVPPDGPDALTYFAEAKGEERGEVFTRREVVEFILELTGWNTGNIAPGDRLLEPSVGYGDFLIPAIERLLAQEPTAKTASLLNRIRAVEVNRHALNQCRERVDVVLNEHGYSSRQRNQLLDAWLIHGDFLSVNLKATFTHVVGNPPYLRQEALPSELLKQYRARYRTMYDRADLYVPFFERGLSLLAKNGRLGFICADRWMKNKYGGPLRAMISEDFHLETYVDFTGCPAFHDEVVAYPAVTVIRNSGGNDTMTAHRPDVCSSTLGPLATGLLGGKGHKLVTKARNVVSGNSPWLLDNPARLNVIRDIEGRFPLLEEAGCKVGIGVATGVDKVFIRPENELPVEHSRRLPIVMTRDVVDGRIVWGGKFVLNPFDGDSPKLVEPSSYPKFEEYIEKHKDAIARRHVARKNPDNWFKTIDRIYPSLTSTPKLLIPDIKGKPTVVFDEGQFYPHHNFYYVTSRDWDLRALQAVLLSPVAQGFVATYSLKMRGDCLRYQAQYLRRIRLPGWEDVPETLRRKLIKVGSLQNPAMIRSAVQELFALEDSEWELLCGK